MKDGAVKKYYSIAGMMVAVNDGTGLQYLLTDHLGSTVAVTNSSGTLTSQQRYLPFGAPRAIPNSPILGTDFTYTGQRKLAPADGMGGIMDYRARFYSPGLGRFQQPDTIIPDQSNPQSWNRFSYVTNRPINFNDPDGHCIPACAVPLVWAAAAVAVVAMMAIYIATVPPPPVLEMGGNRVTRETRGLEGLSNFLTSTDPKNLSWHDNNAKDPCKGIVGKIYCGITLLRDLCIALCPLVAILGSDDNGSTVATSTPKETATPTATNTPSCPSPYKECPDTQAATSTSTPASTATNTSTSTPTLTVTNTATGTATPNQTPTPSVYRRRLNSGLIAE